MKIVLCYPPFVTPVFGPPLGLLYLGSILREQGHEVSVYDINPGLFKMFPQGWKYSRDFELPPDHAAVTYAYEHIYEYCEKILAEEPDVVGFSLLYCNYKFGIKMAEILARKVRCIAGGPQCTFHPEEMLQLGCFHAIATGYGEESIFDMLYADGVFSKNLKKEREYLPDYSFVSLHDYNGMLPVVTTRGCPCRCHFCTHHLPYYYHEINTIARILENAKDVKKIMFNDSNLNANPERTKALFQRLALLKNTIPIHIVGMQVLKGVEEYVHLMAQSGVTEARLGIESGSLRERISMNKPAFTNELALAVIKELTRFNITAFVQFIFCYPDQTEEDRQETVRFMSRVNRECDAQYVRHNWYQFVVHHGTEAFFNMRYGVTTTSPNTWENTMYNPGKIRAIGEEYKNIVPENCQLFVD